MARKCFPCKFHELKTHTLFEATPASKSGMFKKIAADLNCVV